MTHERFDVAYWIREFPLARLRAEARAFVTNRRHQLPREYRTEADFERHVALMMPKFKIVTSPVHVAINEQLRRERRGEQPPSNAVPTDVFVMANGESPQREWTKIGGLPYWLASRPWPQVDCSPMIFLAQINFADSRDIVSGLPEELLLAFDRADGVAGLSSDHLHFEWLRLGDEPLIERAPRCDESPTACYGVIHRTYDVPDSDDDDAVIQATKIAGLPPEVHGELDVPGRYIATIGSVHPDQTERYPFLNTPEPLNFDYGLGHLMWGDVGIACLFLQNDRRVQAAIECY